MANVIDILRERGFIERITHDGELDRCLDLGKGSSYVGFDPTAPSLHVGSLVPIMALAHIRRFGHEAIAVIGGGTARVGDPSGKSEIRRVMSSEEINKNILGIKKQLINFTTFEGKHAILINNADWLENLKYISFLRDIGKYFSVNRMIKAESSKIRLTSNEGLSFIEFNYMIMQAYDFSKLSEDYNCRLQFGGNDQWGNIVAGVNLVKRKNQKIVYGLTFPLITTSSGSKMGKTNAGAVWLDSSMTSPYDYYQFWVNTSDKDLRRFLALFTFLPLEEIKLTSKLVDDELNYAKNILAFEATCLAHGRKEAINAHLSALSVFGGKSIPDDILVSSTVPRISNIFSGSMVPSIKMNLSLFKDGVPAFKLFKNVGLTTSTSSARRLIKQGGGYINGRKLPKFDYLVCTDDIKDMEILLRAGKKKFVKIFVKGS